MSIETTPGGCTVVTGDSIPVYRMLTLRAALRLELAGLKHRGGSVFALVKREFGLRGTRAAVFAAFEALVAEAVAGARARAIGTAE